MWKSWAELAQSTQSKKIVLFGRSEDWLHKTIPHLFGKPVCIVDNNKEYDKTTFEGIPVSLPQTLKKFSKESIFIVITSGSYQSIADELTSLGYKAGENFCVTPALIDLKRFREIHEYDQNILISSSDHTEKSSNRFSKLGGGIYLYNTKDRKLVQKAEGRFRQLISTTENIFAIEYVENAVYKFNSALKVIEKYPLSYPNACGTDYDTKRKLFFIANSEDIIRAHDAETFKIKHEIHFSDKFKKNGLSNHHINDLCVVDDNLYVSYFSKSGNWKKEVFDGGVDEFDIDNLDKPSVQVVGNLWMPHSVSFLNGALCFLESMMGKLWIGSKKKPAGQFPGFIRGVDFDGRFYYVGQSEHMYMHRMFGMSDNIMLNAGFYIFDPETKVSRFHPMMDLVNIHDICILPDKFRVK